MCPERYQAMGKYAGFAISKCYGAFLQMLDVVKLSSILPGEGVNHYHLKNFVIEFLRHGEEHLQALVLAAARLCQELSASLELEEPLKGILLALLEEFKQGNCSSNHKLFYVSIKLMVHAVMVDRAACHDGGARSQAFPQLVVQR